MLRTGVKAMFVDFYSETGYKDKKDEFNFNAKELRDECESPYQFVYKVDQILNKINPIGVTGQLTEIETPSPLGVPCILPKLLTLDVPKDRQWF